MAFVDVPRVVSGFICTVLVTIVLRYLTRRNFVDGSGRAMKSVPGDSRVRRFTHGQEISDKGFELANGKPYVIYNGWQRQVVLCAPEHIREFYQGDARTHWRAPDGNMGYFLDRLLRHSVALQHGTSWKNTRSLFDPVFSHAASMALAHGFRRDIRDWLQSLPRSGPASKQRESSSFTADASGLGEQFTLKLVSRVLYGETLADEYFAELVELARMREALGSIQLVASRLVSKVYGLFPTEANRLLRKYTNGFKEFNLRMMDLATKRGTEIPLRHILNAVQCERRITMEQFLHTIDEILFDNLEVSAAALSYLLINVAGDAGIQEKLRLEAKQAVGNAEGRGFEEYLARSDTLLEFCCAESRRLCPADWFLLCERSSSDKTIGGYHIPAGTDVTIDIKRINIHSALWSRPVVTDQGERQVTGYDFCPERFGCVSRTDCRYNMVGYGVGVRQCLGQYFASLVMRLVLVEIVSRYRITATQGPWDLGFREDKSVLAPKTHDILFQELEPLPF